jgi:hypothetical protein
MVDLRIGFEVRLGRHLPPVIFLAAGRDLFIGRIAGDVRDGILSDSQERMKDCVRALKPPFVR